MEKKAVVLLHGFGEDSSIWSSFVSAFQDEYLVLTPDYSRIDSFKNMEDYADFVYEEIKAKGVEKCAVIGHSMGGYIALALAEKHPEIMRSLGLFHSTAFEDSEERKQMRLKNVSFLEKNGTEAFIRNFTPNLYAEHFVKQYPEKISNHIESSSTLPVTALIAGMNAMRLRPDRKHVLKAAKYPVLFIIGELDKSVPPEDSKAQMMIPKFFSVSILDQVAHMGMVEEPESTLATLEKFLKK